MHKIHVFIGFSKMQNACENKKSSQAFLGKNAQCTTLLYQIHQSTRINTQHNHYQKANT
jgi:hypothetical protein